MSASSVPYLQSWSQWTDTIEVKMVLLWIINTCFLCCSGCQNQKKQKIQIPWRHKQKSQTILNHTQIYHQINITRNQLTIQWILQAPGPGIESLRKRKEDEKKLVKLQFVQNRGLLEKIFYFYGYVQYYVIMNCNAIHSWIFIIERK